MALPTFPMTELGKQLLEAELDRLIKIEREQIKTALAEARELGDLKENAEYHAAKEKQSLVEGRIQELQGKLSRAQVINTKAIKSERIVFGAFVTLFDYQKNHTIKIQIVGEDEAQASLPSEHHPTQHKISYNGPLGKSLIGKEVGDEVIVHAPKGIMKYEVEDFSFDV